MPSRDHVRRFRGLDRFLTLPLVAGGLLLTAASLEGQTLRGSPASLDLQNREAERHDFTYLRTADQVRTFVDLGLLVHLRGNADYELHQVSFPYARTEVRTFVERLAAQYRDACGEKMVVTSLTRPLSHQPPNASARSVHPTGMAVDLRRPAQTRCRSWLEGVLLQLEGTGVLEATRETNPPHYHIVLFPRQYATYVSRVAGRDATVFAAEESEAASEAEFAQEGEALVAVNLPDPAPAPATYRVRPGDSLWTIAQRLGTTVARLRTENDLRGSRIYAGQVILVPGR